MTAITADTEQLPSTAGSFAVVALPLPVLTAFTYACPVPCAVGQRVAAPVGQRVLTGYVVGRTDSPPPGQLRAIDQVLDDEPLFAEHDLAFYRWVADYYAWPLGLTIKAALPAGLTGVYQVCVCVTDRGRREAERDPLLQRLAHEGALPIADCAAADERVAALQEAGLVARCLKCRGRQVKIRTERWYAPIADGDAVARGRQRAVLDWITSRGQVSASDVRSQLGDCAAQLRALQRKGLVQVIERETYRLPPVPDPVFTEPHHQLTSAQQQAADRLIGALEPARYLPLLLHGVTGSGKTEVYLQLMAQVVRLGRQCLYLVPEIALTSQLADRVRSRLEVPVALLHSHLSAAERYDAWRMIRRGEVSVVIGARSAIFASFAQLGAIVVDEEHDASYKQEEGLRYNARDLALVRARLTQCPVVLGSATPALESWRNARRDRYAYAALPERIADRNLPEVHVIDMRAAVRTRGGPAAILSGALQQALADRLDAGQQSLLFLNRRGFAPAYLCRECGQAVTCPNCAVSLIYHRRQRKLACHYCNHTCAVPTACPGCGSFFVEPAGWGTERLAHEVQQLLPAARVLRMDRDSAASPAQVRAILQQMHRQEADILIGTQMIVKGHHLPQVTLVGVVCADQSLLFPDYRAGERTFQLLTQVAGRAGRGSVPGEVYIQAYNPEHYSIACACAHDYEGFAHTELAMRREAGYPPYARMVNICFEGTDATRSAAFIAEVRHRVASAAEAGVQLLGPAPAPWHRLKNRYRYHMLCKGSSQRQLRTLAQELVASLRADARRADVTIAVDIDPVSVL